MKLQVTFLKYNHLGISDNTTPLRCNYYDKYELKKLVHKYVDNWLSQSNFEGLEIKLVKSSEDLNLF